jgi:hypothetical protein
MKLAPLLKRAGVVALHVAESLPETQSPDGATPSCIFAAPIIEVVSFGKIVLLLFVGSVQQRYTSHFQGIDGAIDANTANLGMEAAADALQEVMSRLSLLRNWNGASLGPRNHGSGRVPCIAERNKEQMCKSTPLRGTRNYPRPHDDPHDGPRFSRRRPLHPSWLTRWSVGELKGQLRRGQRLVFM